MPQIGCDCDVCKSPEPKNKRTRASILVSLTSTKHIIIDTAPEFRLQILKTGIKSIAALMYTHVHADHCHGFDDVRAFEFGKHKPTVPTPCYMDKGFIAEFENKFSYVFKTNNYGGVLPHVQLHPIPTASFTVAGVEVATLRLPHGKVQTNAYRFGDFAYATDFKTFPPDAIDAWRGKIKTMVISGVRFNPHPTHSTVNESAAILQELAVEKGYITHLSHDIDYYKHRDVLPANVEFAYDGLEIEC
ncbi:MAG: MBL fold metallo-hydrolase [Pseudomonadota bacterium]|nr:MBL fold metallo-hydrolase [Pseudomonadota bacterium]